jgi:5-methylcytosine-specific restriction endonuclease McrA
MGKLQSIGNRVAVLDIRTAKPMNSALVTSKPFASNWTAPLRLRGRALQARNERIKVRDHYTCQACGLVTEKLQVDHRIPLGDGGTEQDDNLQSLCFEGEGGGCHGAKTRSENGVRQ